LNERRLLFGELLEAGYDVSPSPGFAPALGVLLQNAIVPSLIVLDVQGDEHATPKSVEHLLTLKPGIPLILIVGKVNKALWDSLESRVVATLHRPLTIGGIVEAIRKALADAKPG
jgi:DNA-binding NtrC family response regulator